MVIGVLHIELILHQSQSLKDKRSVMRRIQGRIRSSFEVSVAEVGSQDLWQHGEIGIVTIGIDKNLINQVLDHVLNFVDRLGLAEVVNHQMEFINL